MKEERDAAGPATQVKNAELCYCRWEILFQEVRQMTRVAFGLGPDILAGILTVTMRSLPRNQDPGLAQDVKVTKRLAT